MTPRTQVISLGVALAALTAVALAVALNRDATAQTATAAEARSAVRPALTVRAVAVRSQTWPQTLSATGSVAPWQEVVVGAEIGGQRLHELLVESGDRVKKGQLLARLSPGTLEAELAAARATLLEAEAAAREALANAARVRSLQGSEALSAQAVDQALAAEASAQARLAGARAQVQAGELRLSYTRIHAPHEGLIASRSAVEGQLVQPGQELFRLQRAGRLEWRAEVPGAELARLRPGLKVRLQPAGAPAVEGRLRLIAPQVEAATRNAWVHVDLPAAPGLRAGLFGRGEFVLGEGQALTLPQTAVLLRDGFAYVFQIEGEKVRQRKVQLGRRQQEWVEVREGLDAQAQVVASGLGFLADGDSVRISKGVGAAGPAQP
jgi:RND family efflux transporter MFP subunit